MIEIKFPKQYPEVFLHKLHNPDIIYSIIIKRKIGMRFSYCIKNDKNYSLPIFSFILCIFQLKNLMFLK